jgi:hypothetical protein
MAIFPCAPGQKTPACAHGCNDATTDIIVVQTWWQENPKYNIGIATGPVSGIFIVDIDNDDADGESEWDRLTGQHGPAMPTVEVITARGRHLYFRYPNVSVRNSAGKVAPGLDIRATLDPVVTLELLHAWNATRCTPPLPAEDVERIVNSIAGRELRRRGGG